MTDVALLAVVLVGVTTLALAAPGRQRRARPEPAARPDTAQQRLPAVVVNPIRCQDVAALNAEITQVCAEQGWSAPLWLETSIEDPGMGQARTALAAGADVIMVCGGDGTIRNVAQVLAGSGIALGLLPAGTGNLLARNLSMQLDDTAQAVRIALFGEDRAVDVGWVRVNHAAEEHAFLVMAGMGFDAAIMAGAPARLKARIGPLAYFVSGIRALSGPRFRIALAVSGRPELRRRVRTVVVGNCGRLLAGLVLMPAARIDDGLLDVVTIAPKGIIGWLAVAARVLTRRRSGHPIVEHWQGTEVTITTEGGPQQAQLDGDPVGEARVLRMRVERGALRVRVRAAEQSPASR